jgi:hypothetical protein
LNPLCSTSTTTSQAKPYIWIRSHLDSISRLNRKTFTAQTNRKTELMAPSTDPLAQSIIDGYNRPDGPADIKSLASYLLTHYLAHRKNQNIEQIIAAAGDKLLAQYPNQATLADELDSRFKAKVQKHDAAKAPEASRTPALDPSAQNLIDTATAGRLSPAMLQQLIQVLLNSQQASTPAPAPAIATTTLKRKPPTYNGALGGYEMFKYKAWEIICVEPAAFPDYRTTTAFIFDCCKGHAEAVVWPWYTNNQDCTTEAMWDYMDTQFINKTLQQKAMSQLIKLSQRQNESAHDLFQRFDTLILQAGLQTTNESVKIQYLESALSKDLRALLVTIDAPDNVKEYQIKIANMEERAHRLRGKPSNPNPAASASTRSNNNDAMDWEPTPSQINTIQGGRGGRGQRGGCGANRGGS